MVRPGRRRALSAALCCTAIAGAAMGCSGPEAGRDGTAADGAEDSACVTDLRTPTALVEVEGDYSSAFLSQDAAVVQRPELDARPRVIGSNPALQAALVGTRVWAVVDDGFLVDTTAPDQDEPAQLAVVDGRGNTTPRGPSFEMIRLVQVVGQQFVVDDYRGVSAYDIDTGREVEQTSVDKATTRSDIASSIVLTADGRLGGVLDAGTGRELALDDVLDRGADERISVAGSGVDTVLLKSPTGGSRSTYWTWSSSSGLQEVHTSTDADNLRSDRSPGVCGDHLYLAEHGELRVIDTGEADAVLGRRRLIVDDSAGSRYGVLAIPGGVLVEEVAGATGARRYTWFDG